MSSNAIKKDNQFSLFQEAPFLETTQSVVVEMVSEESERTIVYYVTIA